MIAALPLAALLRAQHAAPESGIARAELEAHVRFLASDELRGRMTGTPECARAASYLAEELKRSGVQPAGEGGTFLQAVPLLRTTQADPPALTLRAAGGEAISAEFGADFDGSAESREELRVVVVAADGSVPAPPDAGAALFIDGGAAARRAKLEAAGQGSGAGWGLLMRAGSVERRNPAEFRPRAPRLARAGSAAVRAEWITLHGPLLARVRAGEIASLRLDAKIEREELAAHNVLGLVRGGAPEEERRTLVLSAHYDHIGARSGQPGSPEADAIFNGADDDASGVAAVLELAEELAAGPPPRHDVLILLAVGEEQGLLGTEHYLDHPHVPLERTLANLNFEMIGRPDVQVGGAGALWLTGYERTNLGGAFEAAGLAIRADPRPDQHFYQRSDNYAFVRRGSIGQTFSSYDLHKDYHQPGDEADRLDYAHMEAAARAAHAAVRLVADGVLAPEWRQVGRDGGAK